MKHSNEVFLALSAFFLFTLALSGCGASLFSSGSESKYYRVQEGDTLGEIGKEFGISPKTLARINAINDPRKLRAGQLLLVRYDDSQPARASMQSTQPRTATQRSKSQSSAVRPVKGDVSSQQETFPQDARSELGFPLASGSLASLFGPRNGSFHDGIDIKAKTGTPVMAAHDGVVAYSGTGLTGYGKMIILRAPSGLMTVYAHNDQLLVPVNARVKRGSQIATVGSTGRSSGPHLHFEVRVKNSKGKYLAVDPMPLFKGNPRRGLRYRINDSLTALLARFTPGS